MATSPADIFSTLGGSAPSASPFDMFAPGGPASDPVAPAQLPGSGSPPPVQSSVAFLRDSYTTPEEASKAIDKLTPGSTLHAATLQKLEAMWKFGHDEMKKQYWRWNLAEQKIQAYTPLTDYQRICEGMQIGDQPPEPVSVIVPYSYATLHAGATFIASVLLGRKPVFPLLGVRNTSADKARYMEQALQSNLDASRGYETLWQGIWDSLTYSFSAKRNGWEERTGNAIRMVNGNREKTTETIFAGNVISSIDPYAFCPDPRVPIHQCNTRGDFMFTEMEQSETVLRDMEKADALKWVQDGIRTSKEFNRRQTAVTDNRRRMKIGIRGESLIAPRNVIGFHTVFEGTVRLVPKDWKLGDSDRSELWKFMWLKGQIIQAEPLGMAHAMHPYVCSEPTSLGHDFMSLSMHDMIGPFQEILSWLVSSRMENVRTSINNQFVADPARVDINDIRLGPIGRIIRLKQAAMGLPIQQAIQQLVVQDVTQGHLADIQTMRILADTITGVNDNMRGIQTAGGRRSATEARMSMQAGASRLSQLAVRISSQDFLVLANQMILNIQQFMPEQMWVETTGDDGKWTSQEMTPDMLMGSFNYQVSDGSLPFDKTALVEVWKEILLGVAQDPELRQRYDIGKIFQYVAELGGAKNIDSFQRQMPTVGGQPMLAGATADPGADPSLTPLALPSPARPIRAADVMMH